MRAVILAVGSELLGADRADTNSLRLAGALGRYGVAVQRKVLVGDVEDELAREIRRALADEDLLILTGGLGPTQDDLTREVVARVLGRPLIRDPEIVEDLCRRFAKFGLDMPASNEKQGDVIEGATVLTNPRGTAPGLRVEADAAKAVFLFPGVPHELEGLIESSLEPWLAERAGDVRLERRSLKLASVPESEIEDRLAGYYESFGKEGLSILPSPGLITVRLTRIGEAGTLDAWFGPRLEALDEAVGGYVYARDEAVTLEEEVARLLLAAGRTLVTAESCTGGGIARRLTAVAGSSAYFLGAAVTYSNELKERMLGVSEALLGEHGAVSEEVALAMARGARDRLGADFGLAVTGIAGPGGGTEPKPVGTVHLALAGPGEGQTRHRKMWLPGDRERVRTLTAIRALDLLRRTLAAGAEG